MRTAYDPTGLRNLEVLKESKAWKSQALISPEQHAAIVSAHPSPFYHPNLMIRILLFVATLIALSGVTGLFGLMILDLDDVFISVLCVFYGAGSFLFLEKVFILGNHHYKSGVTEALLYHSVGFTIGGIAGLSDFNFHIVLIAAIGVLGFAAFRYADLVLTALAIGTFGYFLFFEFYELGGLFQKIIPILFIVVFTPLYFYVKNFRKRPEVWSWDLQLVLAESICLLLIYAAGNYLVVRELSVNLMDLDLLPGKDIPLAFLFYLLTVAVPIAYLYFGIRRKDIILIRVSLFVVAFSVFTFKYYYSTGHPEITLTLAGVVLLIISFTLFRYLKVTRNGYTREHLLDEKWANANLEAFVISQTMGGNKVAVDETFKGGGGNFGGGGASGGY